MIDFREPFDFLGYRFRYEERWQYAGPSGPRRIRELGWKDADRTPSPLALPLPQETLEAVGCRRHRGRAGNHASRRRGRFASASRPDQGNDRDVAISTIERLIVVGPAGWSPDAPGKLLRHGLPVHFLSDGGWPMGDLLGEVTDDPRSSDGAVPGRRRPGVCPGPGTATGSGQAQELRRSARGRHPSRRADCRPLARNGGAIDGRANRWTRCAGTRAPAPPFGIAALPSLLGGASRFKQRVAPDASDP